jgi:hypothetical protein
VLAARVNHERSPEPQGRRQPEGEGVQILHGAVIDRLWGGCDPEQRLREAHGDQAGAKQCQRHPLSLTPGLADVERTVAAEVLGRDR